MPTLVLMERADRTFAVHSGGVAGDVHGGAVGVGFRPLAFTPEKIPEAIAALAPDAGDGRGA